MFTKMDQKFISLMVLITLLCFLHKSRAQHEDIPYQDVQKICETCVCLSTQYGAKGIHHRLDCTVKNFKHILARWPQEFGKNHIGIDIEATFSGNSLDTLQQLPATNASLTFSCSHCDIKHLQVPTFMDVPNIRRLDLSWNEITTDELTPDVFRGPYRATHYEPIALLVLDLSHNQLHSLNKKLFEHTPNLGKLDLSYNQLGILDSPTALALAAATNLEILDLSHTGIKSLPAPIFAALFRLNSLNLAGNQLTVPPANIHVVGKSLETLNLAGNHIERISEQHLQGLKVLKRLNISDLPVLNSIGNSTFTRLESLKYLYCSHNSKLEKFDLDSLMHCANLTELDISFCSISTLSLPVNLTQATENMTANTTRANPWPKLRTFKTIGNPWLCDCELLQTLEDMGAHHQYPDGTETRCESPYIFAGARLSNLTAAQVCPMHIPKKYRVIDEDPPRFLRKRYIILTAITASAVIVLGLMIGFLVSCIRRRLKSEDFGVEPIRYTSVRSSNLSAFSHVNANGNSNA